MMTTEKYFFVIMSILCGIACVVQLLFLRKLKILAVYLLPLLSICLCFENAVMFHNPEYMQSNTRTSQAAKVFESLQVPLFVLLVFEIPCRLHKARRIQFCFIPFDESKEVSKYPSLVAIWLMRLMACGLLVVNLLVYFYPCDSWAGSNVHCDYIGNGGFPTLAHDVSNVRLWLILMVASFLFILTLTMYNILFRYGRNATLSLTTSTTWDALGLTALAQIGGQCFGIPAYRVTSNVGQVLLLFGIMWMVYLVQVDLSVTRHFADFLHRSNVAFQETAGESDPHAHHHHHHFHPESGASATPVRLHPQADNLQLNVVAPPKHSNMFTSSTPRRASAPVLVRDVEMVAKKGEASL